MKKYVMLEFKCHLTAGKHKYPYIIDFFLYHKSRIIPNNGIFFFWSLS